jgi:hypothetical protein
MDNRDEIIVEYGPTYSLKDALVEVAELLTKANKHRWQLIEERDEARRLVVEVSKTFYCQCGHCTHCDLKDIAEEWLKE